MAFCCNFVWDAKAKGTILRLFAVGPSEMGKRRWVSMSWTGERWKMEMEKEEMRDEKE